jgi:hypothetical protein
MGLIPEGDSWYRVRRLIGNNFGSVTSSYFPGDSSDGSAGTGLSFSQMQRQSSFIGWDFAEETANGTEDIWTICEGRDYPRLWWENVQCGL